MFKNTKFKPPLSYREKAIYDELLRHITLNNEKLLIFSTEKAISAYARVLFSSAFTGKIDIRKKEDIGKNADYRSYALVIVVAQTLAEYQSLYAELNPAKDLGLPVVYCSPDRRLFTSAPNWRGSGIDYGGMFYLAAQYARTIRPKMGAYCEFGVYDGRTFIMAGHALHGACGHFYAFDSYRGIRGSLDTEMEHYHDGDYRANTQTLDYNIKFSGLSDLKYTIMPGVFQETLYNRSCEDDGIYSISVVHIDVDVYEPAKLALNYVTPGLLDGSLILFDDYDQISARDDCGERRAVHEWLDENPNLSLELYRTYGVFCRAFIVHRR